ncbi:MAG: hypothetical protein DHS80DRAFT_26385 [Piptocephalis tieghemiana]|nr:MAG: hypothetical protein DHS80DRAFT_26385 [Piptocephalis tieghemiana]
MKKYKTKFPVARIKKIMQADEDVGKMSQATPVLISKALELFLASLMQATCAEAKVRSSRRVLPGHLKVCIETRETFDFLKDTVSAVPALVEASSTPDVDGSSHPSQSSGSLERPNGREISGGEARVSTSKGEGHVEQGAGGQEIHVKVEEVKRTMDQAGSTIPSSLPGTAGMGMVTTSPAPYPTLPSINSLPSVPPPYAPVGTGYPVPPVPYGHPIQSPPGFSIPSLLHPPSPHFPSSPQQALPSSSSSSSPLPPISHLTPPNGHGQPLMGQPNPSPMPPPPPPPSMIPPGRMHGATQSEPTPSPSVGVETRSRARQNRKRRIWEED